MPPCLSWVVVRRGVGVEPVPVHVPLTPTWTPPASGPIDVVVAVPAGPGVRRVVDAGAFVVDALSIVPALWSFYAAAAVSTVVAVFVSPATVALLGVGDASRCLALACPAVIGRDL
ncbi:hypothetical protein CRUP_012570 [Coryphaenoides rupestris]|nr:hypothetical protein CRUP_012570 [Coryphaenoides rupestris]